MCKACKNMEEYDFKTRDLGFLGAMGNTSKTSQILKSTVSALVMLSSVNNMTTKEHGHLVNL